jgi:hypothetical protein
MSKVHDHAEAVTTAIRQIIHGALDDALRQIADLLRDEFDLIAKQTRNEIRLDDE